MESVIKCPQCGSEKYHIDCSRKYQGTTFRRKVCKECGKKFFTKEVETTAYEFNEANVKYVGARYHARKESGV